ncbi:MAG: tripartite tricarboxylate transporter permease [Desulfobacterales bacterium]|nr:tripartite tricarboxylate transporter permease [Desulfobacterales bacterium]
MDAILHIGLGFQTALEPGNLFFCFTGVLIGTLVGVLPGLGPVAAMSLLLPATFHIPPVAAVIMLAGIYYGAMYGGSTTSILVNIPGEAASVVTCLDGYKMARRGRAGAALGIAAFASFIAGTLATLCLMLVSLPLSRMALKFGSPEYFALIFLGLTTVTYMASGPAWKSLVMATVGLFLGCIGMDVAIGSSRFTFGLIELYDGVGIVPVAMGLFGVAEVLLNVEESMERTVLSSRVRNLLPTRRDWADSAPPMLRGSLLGFFLGVLPGAGPVIASFASYAMEKRLSREPERFGSGVIQGVAGPEAANNAATGGAFVPLLTLGIPPNATMALLLGALVIFGLQPGPKLVEDHPQLFWGVIASMYVGNLMLLVLNLPLIGIWIQILKVPYPILFPLILLFCVIGVYSLNNSIVEVGIMVLFGVAGYGLRKLDFEPAPLVLALVLGPMLELNFRQSLAMGDGRLLFFFERPISAVILAVAIVLLAVPLLRRGARWRPSEPR